MKINKVSIVIVCFYSLKQLFQLTKLPIPYCCDQLLMETIYRLQYVLFCTTLTQIKQAP